MTLHLIDSSPLAALGLVALNPLQGALWEMGGTPDEQMQLVQQSDQPSTLIKVSNGDQRAILELDLDGSPIVVDNTVSGVGGIDTGVVAADTVYDLRVISNLVGDDYGATATVSGNAYTPQAGYPWVSPVIGAMVTDGTSDNRVLVNPSQRLFAYSAEATVLTGGTSSVLAAIDLSSFVPENPAVIRARHTSRNTNATGADLEFQLSAAIFTTLFRDTGIGAVALDRIKECSAGALNFTPISGDPATALYYAWNAGVSPGSEVAVLGFDLRKV